jgi:hypothetical protein
MRTFCVSVLALMLVQACHKEEPVPPIKPPAPPAPPEKPRRASPVLAPPAAWNGPEGTEAALPAMPAPAATTDVRRVTIEFTHDNGFGGHVSKKYVAERKSGKLRIGGRAIDETLVGKLLGAATDHQLDGMTLTCSSHTDDEPSYKVSIEKASGPLVLSSTSNSRRHAPWNVEVDGKQLVQTSGLIDQPLHELLHELDPAWKKPALVASTGMGGDALGGRVKTGQS